MDDDAKVNLGENLTFWQLISRYKKIAIPKIQRDYAQGRMDIKGSSLCEEVRNSFVQALKNALVNKKAVVLDYIYGSAYGDDIFYPIDGQQRLTTLFLLHWYIATKENRLDEHVARTLKKFTYEVRDTAKEFCTALIDCKVDINECQSLKSAIMDCQNYYYAFTSDPTVAAMLVMLEEIHSKFKDADSGLWDMLKCDNMITFWALSLQKFGLTDDLFVKMNARGKRLLRFDIFKSDLEAALDKKLRKDSQDKSLEALVDEWKRNIDNDYLDSFWRVFGAAYSERNIFRLVMFCTKCFMAIERGGEFDGSWEQNDNNAQYMDEVSFLVEHKSYFELICKILSRFSSWHSSDFCDLLAKNEPMETNYYTKVKLFGILYYWAIKNDEANFEQFYRVLCNYVFSFREYDVRNRAYNSSISQKTIAPRFKAVKELVDCFAKSEELFYEFLANYDGSDFASEAQKAKYINVNGCNELVELESLPSICGQIHNIFFEDKIHINASQLSEILASEQLKNMCLRIILSYAEPADGKAYNLVFDYTRMQSGKKFLYYNNAEDQATGYCHKYTLNQSTNGFGDKVLTASSQFASLQKAVKTFAKEFYSKFKDGTTTIYKCLEDMLSERIKEADFTIRDSILWYIVAYDEFFYAKDYATFSVLMRKWYNFDDGRGDQYNVYDIRATSYDFDFYKYHYNPFYMALARVLKQQGCGVQLDEASLKITGVQIEYLFPCILSNGWTIRLLEKGNWLISFNSKMPPASVVSKYNINSGTFILENVDSDCILHMASFLGECV